MEKINPVRDIKETVAGATEAATLPAKHVWNRLNRYENGRPAGVLAVWRERLLARIIKKSLFPYGRKLRTA